MHPLFSIHALDRLPISLRACAKRAANGSKIHKDTIISLKDRTMPNSQMRHLLPIFIADLQISRISTLRQTESWEEGRNSELLDGYIGDFIIATEFLTDLWMRGISLPPAAWRELWDLLLPWGTFLCEFEQNIGATVALQRFIGHPEQWQLCLFSSLLLLLEMATRFKNFDDEEKNLRRHLLTSQDVFSSFAHIWSRLLDAWRLELTPEVALMARHKACSSRRMCPFLASDSAAAADSKAWEAVAIARSAAGTNEASASSFCAARGVKCLPQIAPSCSPTGRLQASNSPCPHTRAAPLRSSQLSAACYAALSGALDDVVGRRSEEVRNCKPASPAVWLPSPLGNSMLQTIRKPLVSTVCDTLCPFKRWSTIPYLISSVPPNHHSSAFALAGVAALGQRGHTLDSANGVFAKTGVSAG
ncbi:MYND-type domain-containing protein [Mycena chlorophos]|uniref:MYND-type domain-containing protein n=1 Tax=Mycena chlorophos TaxID=658473 RepID=A0A8H6TN11_MYCCL|nr:MYND-type domain-containing protein [Mycena chlorophos]